MFKLKSIEDTLSMPCRSLIFAAATVLILIFGGAGYGLAQNRRPAAKVSPRAVPVARHHAQRRTAIPAEGTVAAKPAPVTVVNLPEPDILSGEASVTVDPKQPTIIRLGLAQNAVSIVEFPAADGIYYIHEGNPKLASVFQSPTKETDRSITIYPGESFVAGREGKSGAASASITLQMRSGLVLTLELVPVADIRSNAHRCVIKYDRDEVVAARRSAGLAYDLGEEVVLGPARITRASSKLIGERPTAIADDLGTTSEPVPGPAPRAASVEILKAGRRGSDKPNGGPRPIADISKLANRKLADCIRDPKKKMGPWSGSSAGLSLAVSRVDEIGGDRRLVVVGVRNDTAGKLTLVPDSPEFQIQTADTKGNVLQTERIGNLYIESTTIDGSLSAGSIVYYAIVYSAPIMGINQHVRVMVAHREAADVPVAISLPGADPGKE